METNLIAEAVKFMVLGMGIVFLFLIVMVYALKLQAKIIGKYFPEKSTPVPTKPTVTTGAKNINETAKIAAVVAAVQHHKNLKG
ncbi:sodium pump decarboxylase subunit gamma [Arcobacter sp. CECT 8983]|uniref:OadG family protein n=1 Tax=Arcobacter sp. CECT 8983 TaxID=2044508 RepID=UPI00100A831F|nr:OadG family transporter subunit [Arcobacter sp. CECT 8983]RXJ88456.1 sodium pump decarboxylase subunit gamma [Arcobacter sp. CECT 8983]RXJ88654.1 sodium pump decarboxylase subunit gamma [Arcobacter sp. CECT 8983]RXJ89279.1 sodium pump decarboxylase subunit gamma [Arcobacter sp. CECT 8983]